MGKNKISFVAAVMMNVNIMIGAGIFIGPSIMAYYARSTSWFGWPFAALLFTPIVLSIAQISKLLPGRGSFFAYSNQGIGKTAGFLSGWIYFLGYVSITSLQTLGLRDVLITQFKFSIIENNQILFNLLFIASLCLLNLCNLNKVAKIQNGATIFKLTPIALAVGALFSYWNTNLATFAIPELGNLTYAIPIALFGFWGFEACCSISHLIAGDPKNASRAVLLGFFIVALIYSLFHLSILHIMGPDNLSYYGVPGFVSYLFTSYPLFSTFCVWLIWSSIVLAYVSAIFGVIIANTALLHAMSQENLLPFSSFIKKTNANNRPWISILIMGSGMFCFVTFINHKEILTAMSNFGVLGAFLFTLTSLLLIQKKISQNRSWFQAITQSFVPYLAFGSCFLLFYYSWQLIGQSVAMRTLYSLPLLIIILIGFIMYNVHAQKKNSD